MIPRQMIESPRWILWRLETRNDQPTKVPYDAKTLTHAKTNDTTTWCDYDTAADALKSGGGFTGLGFVLGDGFAGVDLDGCIDGSGKMLPWAVTIVRKLDSYTETSPSGTGVKVFIRATLEKGHKKLLGSPVDGGKAPGLEIYGNGRYFAVTGETTFVSDDVEERQEQLDEIIAAHWPKRVTTVTRSLPVTDAIERATKYLERVDPAISGQRGHDVTFRAACALVLGFALSIDEAMPLLAAWNERCLPPWSEKELQHKLDQANKQGGERGYLLRDNRDDGVPVDLSGFLRLDDGQAQPVVVQPEQDTELPLPPGCGLMLEFIEHVNQTAMYEQPEIALAGALALMATLTGRKVRDEIGTRTNLYLLCCAPSGAGKDHARKCLKDLFQEAGVEAVELLGPERLASHAGLISELKETPCKLFPLDECHRLIVTMKDAKTPHLFNIGSLFLTLWSSSSGLWIGDAYGDRDKTPRIWCPHPVVFGSSTSEGLWQSLDSASLSDGLVARFAVFEGRYQLPRRVSSVPFAGSLVDRVRWWSKFSPGGDLGCVNPTPIALKSTPEASDRLYQHAYAIAEKRVREDHCHAALWSRANEKARKLALLSACSRAPIGVEPAEIDLDDANWGVVLANELTRRIIRKAERYVSENESERSSKRLVELIRQRGGKMTLTDIAKSCRWLKSRERNELISSLAEGGIVAFEMTQTATKPVQSIFLTGG